MTEARGLVDRLITQAAAKNGLAEAIGTLPAPLEKLELPRATALVQFCLAIYNLNEFSFVD